MKDELKERVEAKHGPLSEIEVPKTPEGLKKLVVEDPDQFNALLEADRIDGSLLRKAKEKK